MLSRAVTRLGARGFASVTSKAVLEKTALFGLHEELGGKMVEFAGFSLPVQYSAGVLAEHNHTRAEGSASLFDVSHMGQIRWYGANAVDFLHSVVVGDIGGLKPGEATLSLLTNDSGGIIDDTVITSYLDEHRFVSMVVNGATKHGDVAHLEERLAAFKAANPGSDVTMELDFGRHLIALQGPGSAAALAPLLEGAPSLDTLPFMNGVHGCTVAGIPGCTVTRGGYTGEDGFEIAVAADQATELARAFLANDAVKPAGLGARDSLRLEAGLCLYGNDIDATTTPIEAGLAWTVAKTRRKDAAFPGASIILGQLKDKSWTRRRVGILPVKAPARQGAVIYAGDQEIGVVTSGTFSPTLKAPVSMGYVAKGFQKKGTSLEIEVRPGKRIPAEVAPMPFVPARYFQPAAI